MTFQKPGPNLIVSDEGFSVQVLGRTGLLYTDGPREMRVDSELLMGPAGMGVYAESVVSWLPPYDNEVIDTITKQAIIENIRLAFRFDGFEIHVL